MMFTMPLNDHEMQKHDERLYQLAVERYPNSKNPIAELVLRLKILIEVFPFNLVQAYEKSPNEIVFNTRPLHLEECRLLYKESYLKALSANQLLRSLLQPMARVANTFRKHYVNEEGVSPAHAILRDLLDNYLRHCYEATAGGVADHVFYTHQNDPNLNSFNRMIFDAAKLVKNINNGIYNYESFAGENYNEVYAKAQVFNGTEQGIEKLNEILAERICFELVERLDEVRGFDPTTNQPSIIKFKELTQTNATVAALFLFDLVDGISKLSHINIWELLDATESLRRENRSLMPAVKALSQATMWITYNIKASGYVVHVLTNTNTALLQYIKKADKPYLFGLPEELYTKMDNSNPSYEENLECLSLLRQISYSNDAAQITQALKNIAIAISFYSKREVQAKEKAIKEPIYDPIKREFIPLAHNPELKEYITLAGFRNNIMKGIANNNETWVDELVGAYLDKPYRPVEPLDDK